jgi:hypothetical protein
MPTRQEVYAAIDGERDYQDRLYSGTFSSKRPRPDGGALERSIDEFSHYIGAYAREFDRIIVEHRPLKEKLHIMRKIAAMAVACMEQHGALAR